MDTRPIGSLTVSVVGLGCNNFGWTIDATETGRVVDAALDSGITLFDTADIYGGEHGEGEALLARALGARRDRVVLATKFGHPRAAHGGGARPEYVRRALEASLRRLRTDRIDLYQLHTPDPTVPIAETLGALDDLVREGKVREIGCSNVSAAQLRDAASGARARGARFASVQNEYSLLHREPETDGVLDACERHGLAFLPYYPLASGLLTGKYRRGREQPSGTRIHTLARYGPLLTDANLDRVEALVAFAGARGRTVLDLAFAWLLAHPPVASVIAGATKPSQVRANAAASGWTLTPADLAELDAQLAAAA